MEILAQRWMNRARKQMQAAEETDDLFNRRALQHGAFCYLNAAEELKDALAKRRPVAFRIGSIECEMSWGVAMILVGGIGMLAVAIWKY